AGGSGSGKSWTTFEMMLNFVIANDYNNVQFIVMDAKNAPFWNAFARFPHVLGYHYEIEDFIGILEEVEQERRRRQEVLQSFGEEDLKGYRKRLREEGNYEEMKKMPLLFVVIDEITATMATLKDQDEELFKTFSSLLGQIATQGRSSGVRILSIGQRTTFESIPKTLMANSSFKFGMKMEVEADFDKMFGEDIKNYKRPNTLGMGLSKVEGTTTLQNIKTLTIGGKNNRQMLSLIRSLAFDWIRRSHGVDDIESLPEGMPLKESYNRPMFLHKSKKEMEEGRILTPQKVNKGYEFNFDSEDGVIEDVTNRDDEEETNQDEEVSQDDFNNIEEEKEGKNLETEPEQEEFWNDENHLDTKTEVSDNGQEEIESETKQNEVEDDNDSYEDIENSLTDLLGGIDNEDMEKEEDTEINESKKIDEDDIKENKESEIEEGTETLESKKEVEVEYKETDEVKDEKGTETLESKKEGKLDEEGSLGEGSIEDLLRDTDEDDNVERDDYGKEDKESEYVSEQIVKDERDVSEEDSELSVNTEREESEQGSEYGEKIVERGEKGVDLGHKRKENIGTEEKADEVKTEKKESKGEINLNLEWTAGEKKHIRKPVHSHVIENGKQEGLNYYKRKKDLKEVYTGDRIESALERFRINEDGDYYGAKM